MGQKEKLIRKLKSNPKDFTFDEAETLLGFFTYHRSNKGKTSGSRVMFISKKYQTKYCSTNHIPEKNYSSIKLNSSSKH